MFLISCILFITSVSSLSTVAQNQSFRELHHYPLARYYHRHIQTGGPTPLAEDRHVHWIKHLKYHKHKLKKLKKHSKKCGFRFPYELFKRSGGRDGVPYGYGDEYYPRREEGQLGEVMKPPLAPHQSKPEPQLLYSVKYRHYPKKGALEWRPSGDFNESLREKLMESSGIRNGTAEGIP